MALDDDIERVRRVAAVRHAIERSSLMPHDAHSCERISVRGAQFYRQIRKTNHGFVMPLEALG
jgi:hypothetical protein